jgi:hypothetical protein
VEKAFPRKFRNQQREYQELLQERPDSMTKTVKVFDDDAQLMAMLLK